MAKDDAQFVVQPREVRYVSLGEHGGYCFVWLDILDAKHQYNAPRMPYGWHAKYVATEVPLSEIFNGRYFDNHINWMIISRDRNARTNELECLARKAG